MFTVCPGGFQMKQRPCGACEKYSRSLALPGGPGTWTFKVPKTVALSPKQRVCTYGIYIYVHIVCKFYIDIHIHSICTHIHRHIRIPVHIYIYINVHVLIDCFLLFTWVLQRPCYLKLDLPAKAGSPSRLSGIPRRTTSICQNRSFG